MTSRLSGALRLGGDDFLGKGGGTEDRWAGFAGEVGLSPPAGVGAGGAGVAPKAGLGGGVGIGGFIGRVAGSGVWSLNSGRELEKPSTIPDERGGFIDARAGTGAGAGGAWGVEGREAAELSAPPTTRIQFPHFLQRLLNVLPRTFSSATV
ncbi:MAG: hypothetical protein MUC50_14570 [Myxococcota bacterium]|nr:hypothetical protein [Myxococcota bacterium]